MGTSYEFILANNRGGRLCVLDTILEATIVRTVNNRGTLTFVIPDIYPVDYWQRDSRVYVYRSATGAPPTLFENTFYLLRETMIVQGENGQYMRECTCYDLNWLLNIRIINYVSTDPKALITDFADDMLRTIVRDNLGVTASADRDISFFLSVETDNSMGPSLSKSFSFRDMFPTLQEIANASADLGVYLAFDVVALTETNAEFRVYRDMRGVDRRLGTVSPLVLAPGLGNFASGKLLFDWSEEKTVVVAGGKGEKQDRLLSTMSDLDRTSLSPFNYIETFRNATQAQKQVEVDSEASTELRKLRQKIILEGEIIPTRSTVYGKHYGWGDYISVQFKEYTFQARLDIVSISLARNGGGLEEKVEIRVKAETSADLLPIPIPSIEEEIG